MVIALTRSLGYGLEGLSRDLYFKGNKAPDSPVSQSEGIKVVYKRVGIRAQVSLAFPFRRAGQLPLSFHKPENIMFLCPSPTECLDLSVGKSLLSLTHHPRDRNQCKQGTHAPIYSEVTNTISVSFPECLLCAFRIN